MNKEREIDGIRIVVNREQYEAYKGTLQDQINELQDRIDKAKEYIEKQIPCIHDDEILDELLDILEGDNK